MHFREVVIFIVKNMFGESTGIHLNKNYVNLLFLLLLFLHQTYGKSHPQFFIPQTHEQNNVWFMSSANVLEILVLKYVIDFFCLWNTNIQTGKCMLKHLTIVVFIVLLKS